MPILKINYNPRHSRTVWIVVEKKQLISNHRIKQTTTHFSGIPSK